MDEDSLRLLFGNDILVIGTQQANGKIISVSEAFAELSQVDSPAQMVGQTIEQTIWRNWAPLLHQMNKDTLEQGRLVTQKWFVNFDHSITLHRHIRAVDRNGNIVSGFLKVESPVTKVIQSYDFEQKRYITTDGLALTRNDVLTLFYYLQGLSYKTVAEKLCCSEQTVYYRLNRIAISADCNGVANIRAHYLKTIMTPDGFPGLSAAGAMTHQQAIDSVVFGQDNQVSHTAHQQKIYRELGAAIANRESYTNIVDIASALNEDLSQVCESCTVTYPRADVVCPQCNHSAVSLI